MGVLQRDPTDTELVIGVDREGISVPPYSSGESRETLDLLWKGLGRGSSGHFFFLRLSRALNTPNLLVSSKQTSHFLGSYFLLDILALRSSRPFRTIWIVAAFFGGKIPPYFGLKLQEPPWVMTPRKAQPVPIIHPLDLRGSLAVGEKSCHRSFPICKAASMNQIISHYSKAGSPGSGSCLVQNSMTKYGFPL